MESLDVCIFHPLQKSKYSPSLSPSTMPIIRISQISNRFPSFSISIDVHYLRRYPRIQKPLLLISHPHTPSASCVRVSILKHFNHGQEAMWWLLYWGKSDHNAHSLFTHLTHIFSCPSLPPLSGISSPTWHAWTQRSSSTFPRMQ